MNTNIRALAVGALALALVTNGERAARAQDPGTPGPITDITTEGYTDGDQAFQPTGFPIRVEFTGEITYPTDLTAGPFPVVVLLHGRHVTCTNGSGASLEWPCRRTDRSIPSYQGYRYLATNLASYGFFVISVSANGINAADNSVFDLGMQARAELIQAHLDRWSNITSVGSDATFGDRFLGALDLSNVGTMGHSRGGEGVVRHYLFNQTRPQRYGIKAVLPLAPVDFSRPVATNTALEVILPYCDGDVSDLQGAHFYDDARYAAPGDMYPKHMLLVMGANHNHFNTVWTPGIGPPGAADDWTAYVGGGANDPWCGTVPGNHRLTPAGQRDVGNAYMTAFFRAYLQLDPTMGPYLTGDSAPPPSVGTAEVHATYHAIDTPQARRDINRLLVPANLVTNTVGGTVSLVAYTPGDLCGGDPPEDAQCISTQPSYKQPHTVPSARSPMRGLSQLRGGWSTTSASFTNNIPATMCPGGVSCRDVGLYEAFSFRVSVNFGDSRNPAGMPRNFRVVLTDGSGTTGSVSVASVTSALYYPPGSIIQKVLLNGVRIPLPAFGPDLDYSNITSVQFVFDQNPSGALLITDLAFSTMPF